MTAVLATKVVAAPTLPYRLTGFWRRRPSAGDESPLPPRLEVGAGRREADVSEGPRPRGHQPQTPRRGLRRGGQDRPGRVRPAPAAGGRRLVQGRGCGDEHQ